MEYTKTGWPKEMPTRGDRGMTKIYTSDSNIDGKYYVNGPGDGCGYASGYLWPELATDNEEANKIHAKFANIGYREGYKKAQAEMRKAAGLSE